jgi:outer membrane protein assembly factor BamB
MVTLLGLDLAAADDWPQAMGPGRDSIWSEKGVTKEFSKEGPKVKWRTPVNLGYGGPAVVGERVYLMDYIIKSGKVVNDPGKAIPLKGVERVLCLHAETGKEIWKQEYSVDYELSYPSGPRCTPTVSEGKVYALGAMGHLRCLDAETGTRIWEHNLPKKYGADIPIWGHSGHPLVFKNRVYCLAGGEGSVAVCLDAKTGQEVWTSLSASEPGYAPPMLMRTGSTEQLLIFTPQNLHALNPSDGKEYWKVSIKPDYNMSIMAPRESKGRVYVSGIGRKGLLLKVNDGPEGASPSAKILWRSSPKEGVYCANSTPIILGEVIYGNDIRTSSLMAVDLKDGKRLWTTRAPTLGEGQEGRLNHGTVFLVYHRVNKLFYLFNEQGDLIIAELNPAGYKEISRAHILEPTNEAFGRKVVWSMPALANKCVFVRNDQEIVCVDLAE